MTDPTLDLDYGTEPAGRLDAWRRRARYEVTISCGHTVEWPTSWDDAVAAATERDDDKRAKFVRDNRHDWPPEFRSVIACPSCRSLSNSGGIVVGLTIVATSYDAPPHLLRYFERLS